MDNLIKFISTAAMERLIFEIYPHIKISSLGFIFVQITSGKQKFNILLFYSWIMV